MPSRRLTLGSAVIVQDSTRRYTPRAPSAVHIGAQEYATTQNQEAKRRLTEQIPGTAGMHGSRARQNGKVHHGVGGQLLRPQDSAHRAHVQDKEREKGRRAKGKMAKGKAVPSWSAHRPLHHLRPQFHLGPRRKPRVHLCLRPPMRQQQLRRPAIRHRM